MNELYMLKRTAFGIDRDYPREINEARKQLYKRDEAKRAREEKNKMQIKYPARLFIEGKCILDELPDWLTILGRNRISGGGLYSRNTVVESESGGERCINSEQLNVSESDSDSYTHSDMFFDMIASLDQVNILSRDQGKQPDVVLSIRNFKPVINRQIHVQEVKYIP